MDFDSVNVKIERRKRKTSLICSLIFFSNQTLLFASRSHSLESISENESVFINYSFLSFHFQSHRLGLKNKAKKRFLVCVFGSWRTRARMGRLNMLKTFGDQDTRATVTKNIKLFYPCPPFFCFPENREHELFMQMKTAFVVVTGRIHCLFGDNLRLLLTKSRSYYV